jgi:hypothetical protein
MSFLADKPSFIVKNLSSKTVNAAGLRLKPGKTADLFDSVVGLTENMIITLLSKPRGPLYLKFKTGELKLISSSFVGSSYFDNQSIVKIVITDTDSANTKLLEITVLDLKNNPIPRTILELAVFDDASITTLAVNATLCIATKGIILSSAVSTVAVKIQTNEAGVFECKLRDNVDEQVWVASFSTPGSAALDCREIKSTVFRQLF